MEQDIFKKSIFDNNKLIKYGFIKKNNIYTYTTNILNNKFRIEITINKNKLTSKIYDIEMNDEYLNINVISNQGTFINKIRTSYQEVLIDIKNRCCINNLFLYSQTNRITEYISKTFNIEPEFLFNDESTGVFRNNKKKWFGIIMHINKNKLTNEDKDIEVINIKLDPLLIIELIKKEGYYKAYHMNKKYWISITLDDTVNDKEIIKLIKESYDIIK